MTPFQIKSVLRREALFRENVSAEPRVEAVAAPRISENEERQ
jgi:hypothetical protein